MAAGSRWAVWSTLFLAMLAIPACETKTTAPMLFRLSGHVRMTGYLLADNGAFLGTRVVGDADGILVQLLYGDRVVASTTTVKGVYTFTGVRPGGYVARAPIVGTVGDETRPLTVAAADVAAADTLRLESSGDLYPVPNPSVDSCQVFYEVAEAEHVIVRVIRLDGTVVQTITDNDVLPETLTAVWDGLDNGAPATAPYYWVTFESGEDYRAQLLFR